MTRSLFTVTKSARNSASRALASRRQQVSHLNPFFYMIDGFRRGFFGVSDVSPWMSLGVVSASFLVIAAIALRLLASGYKLRH